MPVTLSSLIKVAPFKEETRQKLLTDLSSLTESERFYLSETCWNVLSQTYYAQVRYAREKIMLEVQEGKRKFNPRDFEEAEQQVNEAFSQKLKNSSAKENIEDVRSELQKHLKKPGN